MYYFDSGMERCQLMEEGGRTMRPRGAFVAADLPVTSVRVATITRKKLATYQL